MKTWKTNLEETKQRYINWWNHKGIILSMWEHFQEGVKPHADVAHLLRQGICRRSGSTLNGGRNIWIGMSLTVV